MGRVEHRIEGLAMILAAPRVLPHRLVIEGEKAAFAARGDDLVLAE